MVSRARVALFAAFGGALTGLVLYAFLRSLDWATRTRIDHGWLVWLLPVAGLLIALVYHYWGGRAKGGTPGVIEQAHTFTHGVPARMTPLILGGSIVGHLFGASVGREGAALQLAGSVTDSAAAAAKLSPDERRTLIAASLAGGWGAVFGVPFTGVLFSLQMARGHRWKALVPAVISAFTGKWVVDAFGYTMTNRPHLPAPNWTIGLPFKLMLAGVAAGLLGRLFVLALKTVKQRMAFRFHWPPIRAVIGGAATVGLLALVGRDYLGLSTPLVTQAFSGHHVHIWVPFLKLAFTAIALGTGFVGGEVAPLFVMGSTLGAAISPALNAPSVLVATTSSAAAFASAASVAITGVVLTVEQFGWHTFLPALIVGGTARLAAGRPGLYVAH